MGPSATDLSECPEEIMKSHDDLYPMGCEDVDEEPWPFCKPSERDQAARPQWELFAEHGE